MASPWLDRDASGSTDAYATHQERKEHDVQVCARPIESLQHRSDAFVIVHVHQRDR